ncbi:hypothetical protein QTO02_09045, partial [Vibrio fortis]
MAEVEIFDWAGTPAPNTRYFESRATIQKYKYEKGSSLSTRALDMAGVERFELPTRGFGIRC